MTDTTTDIILKRLESLHNDINNGFERINGRVRAVEQCVAGHEERLKVQEAKPSAVKAIILTGAVVSALTIGAGFVVRMLP